MKGMSIVNNMAAMEKMLSIFENQQVFNLTFIKQNTTPPGDMNMDTCEAQVQINEPVVLSVDNDGVIYTSDDESVE